MLSFFLSWELKEKKGKRKKRKKSEAFYIKGRSLIRPTVSILWVKKNVETKKEEEYNMGIILKTQLFLYLKSVTVPPIFRK